MIYRLMLIALGALLVALVCAASSPGDITGYSSGSNVWTLGAEYDSVNLDGFENVSGSDGPDTYHDASRTIQFNGKDTKVEVYLYFTRGYLEMFTINVPAKAMSFKALKKYYAARLSKCKHHDYGESSCDWVDKDKDYVSLGAVTDESSGADITAINYGWRSYVPVAE